MKKLNEEFTIEEAFRALNIKKSRLNEAIEEDDLFTKVYDSLFFGGQWDSKRNAAVQTPYDEDDYHTDFLKDGFSDISIIKDSKDDLKAAEDVAKKFNLEYNYSEVSNKDGKKQKITIFVPDDDIDESLTEAEEPISICQQVYNLISNGDKCGVFSNEIRTKSKDNSALNGKINQMSDDELKKVLEDCGFTIFDLPDKKPCSFVVLADNYNPNENESLNDPDNVCPDCGKSPCICECDNTVNEDIASSMPVEFLPVDQVRDFIVNLPAPNPNMPPRFFKLGYMRELIKEIPSRFKGGRGSEGSPIVRIFKAIEYSALYTGSDWKGTNATKAADKVLGTERHTGEKTGFGFNSENDVVNRIGTYRDGSEALQAYIADHSKQKVKFFISLDDGDLQEATKEEVAEYLTPAQANRVLNPTPRAAAGVDTEGNDIFDKPIQRFKLNNIYMIGSLGHSIM